MKISIKHVTTLILTSLLLLGSLAAFFWHSNLADAQAFGGQLTYTKNISAGGYVSAASVDVVQNGDIWVKWDVSGASQCDLQYRNIGDNSFVRPAGRTIVENTSPSGSTETNMVVKMDTSTVLNYRLSLRCDDASVAGYNPVEVSAFNSFTVSAPALSGNQPPLLGIQPLTPDCVIGYPKIYEGTSSDPEGDRFQVQVRNGYPGTGPVFYSTPPTNGIPSVQTISTGQINSDLEFIFPAQGLINPGIEGVGGAGYWANAFAAAVDDKGAFATYPEWGEWQEVIEYGSEPGVTVFNSDNEQLCVFNLDEGLVGGDSDGTDLVVRVNNGAWSAASAITIQEGDKLEFRWRSSLDACTARSGPGLFVFTRAGVDDTISEPPLGGSYTYNLECNRRGYIQEENITVTTAAASAPAPAGVCGSSANSCSAGTFRDTADTTTEYRWSCDGTSTNASCSAPLTAPPAGAVVADIGVTINNALQGRLPDTRTYIQMYPGDTIQTVNWMGPNNGTYNGATSCTVTRPDGTNRTVTQSSDNTLSLVAPAVGTAVTYSISCTNGSVTEYDSVTIEMVDTTPVAELYASVNGGTWKSGNVEINDGDIVQLYWASLNISSCTSGDFNTNSARSGGPVSTTNPAVGASKTYTMNCTGPYGSVGPVTVTITNLGTNTPPSAPVITGATTGNFDVSYTFTTRDGVDPDGDGVRYAIDWNNDGTVDQYTAYGASGFSVNSNYNWSGTGVTEGTSQNRTFCAWTHDDRGGVSGQTCHTINLTKPIPPAPDLKINGSDGPTNAYVSDTLDIVWDLDGLVNCTLSGRGVGVSGGGSRSVSANGSVTINANNIALGDSETYVLSCGSYIDSVRVTIIPTQLTYQIREGSSAWQSRDIEVEPTSTVDLRWEYVDSGASCSSITSNTGYSYAIQSSENTNGTRRVPTPSGGQTIRYTINCSKTVVTRIYSSSQCFIRYGNSNHPSCFDRDTSSYNATLSAIGKITEKPNLRPGAIGNSAASAVLDPVTNTYSNVRINSIVRNVGNVSAGASEYAVDIDYGADGTYEDTKVGNTPSVAGNSDAPTDTVSFDNVPLGSVAVRLRVDSNTSVDESSELDNIGAPFTFTLSSADPGLKIGKDGDTSYNDNIYVRAGSLVDIVWESNPSATLSCALSGPYGFSDTGLSGSGSKTDVGPVIGKSTFTVTCTDTTNGGTYTDTFTVNTVGSLEEI